MKLVREYKFLDIRLVTLVLMLMSFFTGMSINGVKEPVIQIQCYQYTSDYSTTMLHRVKCPSAEGTREEK